MENIILENGNIAVVKSVRYAFDKCIFSFIVLQPNGYWISEHSETFSLGYYNSVTDFILSNY